MKTVDEEVTRGAMDFVDRAVKADKPYFLWWNSTHMHIWTQLASPLDALLVINYLNSNSAGKGLEEPDQTVTYGEARSAKTKKDVYDNLGQIELKLEAVLDLLPATLDGEDLETARKQINTAFDTMVAGVKKAAPVDAGYNGPNAGAAGVGPGNGSVDSKTKAAFIHPDFHKTAAQPQVGRYQISSWTLPPPSGQGTAYVGAFVIDTETGTVWKVLDGQSPKKLGQVKE